ncbi:MAG: SPOR domain-containing protein [Rickettsiella sp.]|nr:SPOR domain-containing protein [Rickettsiella sp.]
MTKDYAKYSTYQKSHKFSRRVWIIVYLVIALFLIGAGLFFFKSHQKQEVKQAETKLKQGRLETPGPRPPEPEFDFYNILPRDNITLSSQATNDNVSISGAGQAMNLANDESNDVSSHLKKPLNSLLNSTPEQVAMAEVKKQLDQEMSQLGNEVYILVLGTFQAVSQAERYQAQALLRGFSVQSKVKTINGHKTYQLFMGPYSGLALAAQDQKRLNAAGMSSILFKSK